MKKSIYRSTLLIVLFSLLIFIGGCTVIPKSVRKDLIVGYLNDKYTDDHFEFVDYVGGKPWSDDVLPILCSSKNYPNKNIKVSYFAQEDKYYDSYYEVKYAKELDKYVSGIEKELFPGYKTNHLSFDDNTFHASMLDLPPNTTFKEYLRNSKVCLKFCCESKSYEIDKKFFEDNIDSFFKNSDLKPHSVEVYFSDNIDRDLSEVIDDTFNYLFICYDKDGEIIKEIEWRK